MFPTCSRWARPWASSIRSSRHSKKTFSAGSITILHYPQRLVIAFGALLLTWIVPWGLWSILIPILSQFGGPLSPAYITVSVLLSLFGGVMMGFAGACFLTPLKANGTGALDRALLMAAALVLLPVPFRLLLHPASASLALFQAFLHFALRGLLVIAVYFLTTKKPAPAPTMESPGTPPPLPKPPASPALALLLGFAPAGMILVLITCASSGVGDHMSNEATRAWLITAAIASLGCCLTASILLFKRKTSAALAGGILLLLLNAFIAFFFGCTASFIGASFH
ncbi:MAG: hypothetical protein QM796_22490 [Chthoniobacteraceae bacterium]